MKHLPLRLHWIMISAILMLALTSCVLPVPSEDGAESPEVVPTAEMIIISTAPPVDSSETDAPVTGETPVEDATTEETVGSGTDETTDTPVEESGSETEAETPAETSPPVDEEITHVVQSGETLGHIAEKYDVSIADIAAANGITDIDTLEAGQELIIKAGAAAEAPPVVDPEEQSGEQVHVVQTGENLFRIGLRYGFSAEELAAYNNIPDVTRIDVGQIIKIPPK